MKFLVLVAAVVAVWWTLRLLRQSPRASAPPKHHQRPRIQEMIACDRCGLHVPEDEAIHRNGKHYCSEEHAREERH